MGEFKFNLKEVLEHRENIEEICKREFGEARRALNRLLTKREKIENEIESIRKERAEKILTDFDPAIQSIFENYMKYLKFEREIVLKEIKKQEEILEAKRVKLENAMKDCEIIKKLKEKEFSLFLQEEKRKENKFFDTLSLRKHWAKG